MPRPHKSTGKGGKNKSTGPSVEIRYDVEQPRVAEEKYNLDDFETIPLEDIPPTEQELYEKLALQEFDQKFLRPGPEVPEIVPERPPVPEPTQHKAAATKKVRLGFSESFDKVSAEDAAQLRVLDRTYGELSREINEYRQFVLEAATKLYAMEGDNSALEEIIHDLNELDYQLLIDDHVKMKDLDINDRNESVWTLNKQLGEVSAVADRVIVLYINLHPTQGSTYSAKNNTILNNILDNFKSFVDKLKTKFGYTEHLKRNIVSDIRGAKANHRTIARPK